jgi:hypothetical protein
VYNSYLVRRELGHAAHLVMKGELLLVRIKFTEHVDYRYCMRILSKALSLNLYAICSSELYKSIASEIALVISHLRSPCVLL